MLIMMAPMLIAAAVISERAAMPPTEQISPGQQDGIDRLLQQAVVDARAGRNAEALTYLDPIATAVSDGVRKTQGLTYCAQSSVEANIYLADTKSGSKVAQLMPAHFCTVLFMRAYVLENLNRLPEAIDQLRHLVLLEPNLPHYQVEYGAALRAAGDMDAALATYRRAADLAAPIKEYALDWAAALRGIGFVLTERGDLDGAEKSYQQSLEIAPGHPVAVNELAYIARLRVTGVKTRSQSMQSSINPANVPVLPKGQPR